MTSTIEHDHRPTAAAPYRVGERVRIVAPDGSVYLARVEDVEPVVATADVPVDGFSVVAAITSPRRARNQVVVTRVGLDGSSAFLAPYAA